MIFDVAQVILGLLFFFFIPGFIVVKIFFDNDKFLEKAMLSVLFSVIIGLIISVFFGYDPNQAVALGGFTQTNAWMGEIVVVIVLGMGLLTKRVFYKESLRTNRKECEKKEKKKKESY